jgi:hypothetical protein
MLLETIYNLFLYCYLHQVLYPDRSYNVVATLNLSGYPTLLTPTAGLPATNFLTTTHSLNQSLAHSFTHLLTHSCKRRITQSLIILHSEQEQFTTSHMVNIQLYLPLILADSTSYCNGSPRALSPIPSSLHSWSYPSASLATIEVPPLSPLIGLLLLLAILISIPRRD